MQESGIFFYYLFIFNHGPGANDLWKISFCNSAKLGKKGVGTWPLNFNCINNKCEIKIYSFIVIQFYPVDFG